ncbi:hypothetical protein A0H81_05074 [Grifola frondosa]|uniref:F-box domain-containing protein n=1 Tax=Grifola frondosa TaxID=5627 RepID=A0A1C7MDD9_GRIFR|nr:hypothetical protein A0H81_05074 [Grifola frondosa]
MAITRSQSGKLPPPLIRANKYGCESKDNNKKVSRARKRTKTTVRGTSARNATSRRKKAALSALPTMPIDILFEIFANLTPRDLLNLTRTNKPFRQLLMTRKAITVWRAARKNELGAPDCLPGMSEPQWASLLWGGNICQQCARNVTDIDLVLLRRVCVECMREHLVQGAFSKAFEGLDPAIMKLVPYSNASGWVRGYKPKAKFYWDADIYDMSRKLDVLKKDIHMDKPGAREALEKFKAAQIAHVDVIMKHAAICKTWVAQIDEQRENDELVLRKERLEIVRARLVELGYDYRDATAAVTLDHLYVVTRPLTDRLWKQISRTLKQRARASQKKRLAREYREIIHARSKIVCSIYEEYRNGLTPLEKIYTPYASDVWTFEGFKELIFAPAESSVEAAHFSDTMKKLPALCAKFAEERKAILLDLVPSPPPNSSPPGISLANVTPADLATSIFTCSHCYSIRDGPVHTIYAGSEQSILHVTHEMTTPDPHSQLTFNHTKGLRFDARGSLAAASLVGLLGLNEHTAVPRDLDKIGARFFCNVCGGDTQVLPAMTWRQCVTHFSEPKSENIHSTPSWYRLTEEKFFKCSRSTNNAVYRSIVHLKTEHTVHNPVEDEDFFLTPKLPYPVPPSEYLINTDDKVYKCLRCDFYGPTRERTFKRKGVEAHLRDSHRISPPTASDLYRLPLP